MARKQRRPEVCPSPYSSLPWSVLDSHAYQGATPAAKALLVELIRQHSGSNNGRLHVTHKWLAPRGWASKETVARARDELIERGLIVQTRRGGLNAGASWFALTWLPISNHAGLETSPSAYHLGAWQLCDSAPTQRRNPPAKKIPSPDHRDSADPTIGTVSGPTAPVIGSREAIFDPSTDPTIGDDVSKPVLREKSAAGRQSEIDTFKARWADRAALPKRPPNPLGRGRNIRLFKVAFGHLAANPPANRPDRLTACCELIATKLVGASSITIDRAFPTVRRLLAGDWQQTDQTKHERATA